MMYEGSVDRVTTTKATGWLYDRAEGRSFDVVAILHGRVIGEASASLHRPDLEEVGFGDGLCGFDLPFHEPVRDVDISFVTVRPRGSNLSIPRTAEDTYVDLVGDLTAKYPSAGRNRSVLGGFWTDRTDALQILAGRIQAGSCPATVKELMRRLIADGYVTLPAGPGGPLSEKTLAPLTRPVTAQPGAVEAAAADLAHLLVTEDLAALLRTVFDDVPIAYSFAHLTTPSERMAQASAFEPLTSPAEVLAIYLPIGGRCGSRLDFVRDSHEFPEFSRTGRSRWIAEEAVTVPSIVAGQEQPIDSLELMPDQVVVVSPGLIHRTVPEQLEGLLQLTFAPKRNIPVRFVKEKSPWQDFTLGSHMRMRL